MWDVGASPLLVCGFFFHTLRSLHFPQEEESRAAIQVFGPLGLSSLPPFFGGWGGGTHPKENSSVAKNFPSVGGGLPTNSEPSWVSPACIKGKSPQGQDSMWVFSSLRLPQECLIPPVNEWW